MRTTEEVSISLRAKVQAAMRAAAHIKAFRLEYLDINVTAEPGEPELYKECGCNGAELLALLDAFDLHNVPHQARAIASRPECGCSAYD